MFINEIEVVSTVLEAVTDPVLNGPIYTSGDYVAGPPPATSDNITTESGDTLTTESGDALIQEG